MAYNNAIPQAGNQISQSQSQILDNFIAIQALIDIDHVDFANSNMGQHNKVSLVTQGSTPTFTAGQVGLYGFLNTVTSSNELYISKGGGPTLIPVSAGLLTNPGGFSYFASGLILKWGNSGFSGNNSITINVNTYNPGFTTSILSVNISLRDSAGTYNNVIGITNIGTTTFQVAAFNGGIPPSTVSFTWLALGY